MSRRFVVTRHPGTRDWLAKHNVRYSLLIEHLDLSVLEPGDEVLGTLPLQMANRVFQKGAFYYHLVLDTPFAKRGMELSAAELEKYGARFEPFEVSARPLTVPYQQWLERQVSEFVTTAPPVELKVEQAESNLSNPEGIPVVVCVASDKNLPNWLVYKELANQFAPTPVHCWIVCSKNKQVIEYSEALRTEVLQDQSRKGASPSQDAVKLFSDLPESYAQAKTYLQDCLMPATAQFEKEFGQKPRLLLNLTGGKKTMSLALNDVGRQLGAEMLYFHGNSGFEWLDPTGQRTGMQAIHAVAQPKTLLGLYGFKSQKPYLTGWHTRVANEIARRILGESEVDLGKLNDVLHNAKSLETLDKSRRYDEMLDVILRMNDVLIKTYVDMLTALGAFVTDESGKTTLAKKGTGKFFFRSGWFEVYFQDALQRVIRDSGKAQAFSEIWSGNLRIEDEKQVAREIDALFLYGSDLWIAECKAKGSGKDGRLRGAIDQSTSLASMLGGQNTKSLIVYAGECPSSKTTKKELEKTKTILIHGVHCRPDRIQKSIAISLGLQEPDSFWLKGDQAKLLSTCADAQKPDQSNPADKDKVVG